MSNKQKIKDDEIVQVQTANCRFAGNRPECHSPGSNQMSTRMRLLVIAVLGTIAFSTVSCKKKTTRQHHQYLQLPDGGRIPLKSINLRTFVAQGENESDGGTLDHGLPDGGASDEHGADAIPGTGRR